MPPYALILTLLILVACKINSQDDLPQFPAHSIAHGFDFPVGKPDGQGYYNAQHFGKNKHLGDDWNGIHGGNSDKGDSIFAIANGFVHFSQDMKGSWGPVIRIWHKLPDSSYIESIYAHMATVYVGANSWVKKGDTLGTIGTAHGKYLAHLHLEIRDSLFMPLGPGYGEDTVGYHNPEGYLRSHR